MSDRPLAPIDPRVDVGHVHLKVADIDRALAFWRDVVFLSAGGYHHHIALNAWRSRGGDPPPPGATGLFHVALRYPTRPALATAVLRLVAHGVRLDGAADHGVSEAVYLHDPDRNGVELSWDRPRERWPRDDAGALAMTTAPLDLDELLASATTGEHGRGAHPD